MLPVSQNLTEIKSGYSNKKVFRLSEKKMNKIIIDFSKDKKEFYNFLNIYQILSKVNVSIPKIYEVYTKNKSIIMEDFGDATFDKIYNDQNLYSLLRLAVDNLIIIQNSLTSSDLNELEEYSFKKLRIEISEFVDYYIPYKKIKKFPKNEFYNCWETSFRKQKFEFKSFNHKDYEFINLIFTNEKNNHLKCGIIDFQSAFIGFSGWDLFSILENPRVYFSSKYNHDLIKYYHENVNTKIKFDSFQSQYYLLNLARLTRLLGRWIKLLKTQNNKTYLNYLQCTEKRILSSLNYIESENLKSFYKRYIKNYA